MFLLLRNAGRYFCCAFAVALAICFSSFAFAQQADPRPVARLITSRSASASRRTSDFSVAAGGPGRLGLVLFSQASSIERRAFEMTNKFRLQKGLKLLGWDPALCRMARLHSERMARESFFSHQTPEGKTFRDRLRDGGILTFRTSGENIAYNQGYEDPGEFAVERWMVSPGHRANILNIDFEASAVGAYVAPDGSVFLTQEFISR